MLKNESDSVLTAVGKPLWRLDMLMWPAVPLDPSYVGDWSMGGL